jgi:transposase InsO family protein
VRHRPPHRNPVWAYDFVAVRTKAGRPLNLLPIVAEYPREWLAIDVDRRVRSDDVLHRRSELVVQPGAPEPIRSANGPEFAAKAVREWRRRGGGYSPCSLNPAAPWENGSVERVNGKRRDELLKGESFETRWEATVLIARWRRPDNQIRPHRSLSDHPPAPEAREPRDAPCA